MRHRYYKNNRRLRWFSSGVSLRIGASCFTCVQIHVAVCGEAYENLYKIALHLDIDMFAFYSSTVILEIKLSLMIKIEYKHDPTFRGCRAAC